MADGSDQRNVLEATVRVPQHVVFRSFVAETVLLNIETCRYHGLNATGGEMLKTLTEVGNVRAAAARVADEYGAPLERVETDIVELCEQLADRGLLVIEEPAAE